MAEKECLFCQIITGKVPSYQVYQNDRVIAFLDLYPISKGHTLIVPKAHQKDIRKANTNDLLAAMQAAKKLSLIYEKALGAVGFNLKSNHGRQAHQEIMHLHFHLIPRYPDDGLDLTDNHYEASEKELKQVKKSITSHLSQS